ncbi:hypothetical protein BMETH_380_2 [methanotrophic bacterial endosymbiont of Bathymodiolus sp.]|nr:hypothetical protein BMETH_380_2 [methanotrophic bacterial endosymbiont of Bathymodiolus sp.]
MKFKKKAQLALHILFLYKTLNYKNIFLYQKLRLNNDKFLYKSQLII